MLRSLVGSEMCIRDRMWVRAATLGAHTLHFVFAYASSIVSVLKHRLCPLSAKLRVLPAFLFEHAARPLTGGIGSDATCCISQYALAIHLQNIASAKRLLVTQLSCISHVWRASMLYDTTSDPRPQRPTEAQSVNLCVVQEQNITGGGASSGRAMHSELVWNDMRRLIDSRDAPHLHALLRTNAQPVIGTDSAIASRVQNMRSDSKHPPKSRHLFTAYRSSYTGRIPMGRLLVMCTCLACCHYAHRRRTCISRVRHPKSCLRMVLIPARTPHDLQSTGCWPCWQMHWNVPDWP